MKTRFLLLLAGALLVLAPLSAQVTKAPSNTSNAAITGSTSSTRGAEGYATGFEGSEGFTPGYLGTQSGWSVFLVSTTQPVIETANPNTGTQHLRIAQDPAIAPGNLTGGFSPVTTPSDDMEPSTVSLDVFISGLNGADYDVAPQSPTQGFLTARVNFRFTGPIRVLDGGVFVDTGVTWTPNQWMNLRIETDPTVPQIDYYLDDNLIYTANALVGATTVEQVVLISDNFHIGDVGDFDNFEVQIGTVPSIPVTEVPTAGFWGLLTLVTALGIGGLLFVRRLN